MPHTAACAKEWVGYTLHSSFLQDFGGALPGISIVPNTEMTHWVCQLVSKKFTLKCWPFARIILPALLHQFDQAVTRMRSGSGDSWQLWAVAIHYFHHNM